eukprot:366161-Chlamydomonas_euryale.AAC.6
MHLEGANVCVHGAQNAWKMCNGGATAFVDEILPAVKTFRCAGEVGGVVNNSQARPVLGA